MIRDVGALFNKVFTKTVMRRAMWRA